MLNKDILEKYNNPEFFFNRELSWLEFNRRVLEEALNPELPLLDRIKFISIFSSNLDEFYMIRVSGLKDQIRANAIEEKIDGLNPYQEIKLIESEVNPMLEKIYTYWDKTIVTELKENNIFIHKMSELTKTEKEALTNYFNEEIFPVLTPLAFDPGRPFPYISNLSLSFAIVVQKPNGEEHFARVKIPSILPRLIRIDTLVKSGRRRKNSDENCARFVWMGDLIGDNLESLFPGMEISEAHRFRIIRNTDMEIQEDEADDLLQIIEANIKQRKFGSVVRLEIEKDMPEFMIKTLSENLQISDKDIHISNGPLGLSSVMKLYSLPFPQLKEKPFHPVTAPIFEEEGSIFSKIKNQDILIHHPYESFAPVIDFIKEAVQDPDVLAIKQTLYRIGPNSPIVKSLIEAAERKKQVAVLVELKARFDEENNIFWARELEKAGVHVVYGLVGLKTHGKMTLVVRKENNGVQRYVHLSTGNYNPDTAKIYTDYGVFSADIDLCKDVSDLFNYLTGYSAQKKFRKISAAPINLRKNIIRLIEQEIENVKQGKQGKIIFKMNALVDPYLIAALYEASSAGVEIELIVRGICCLVPQVNGLSDNIKVRSIVGRFLEHHRIYYFYNNGTEKIFLSSADLMPRNLDRRVEVFFPIEDKAVKKNIIKTLLVSALEDNINSKLLLPNGKYVANKYQTGAKNISMQEWLMSHTKKLIKKNTANKK